ncbi:MAG: DNA polymerase IV, partial [Rhodospirillaceae bacterium]|nr:DNA polymerase IV [Rhodospirillaceae bacterium]
MIGAICRDCGASQSGPRLQPDRCEVCASPRLLAHAELHDLAIAHIDCDAFYASVEKRERPELANKPVIVGGQKRGVVAACCYIARLKGVHSAMPMFQARKACPDAVVIPPDMELYRRVGGQIRELMLDVTPLVEPLSVDEAFLDLSGTERLHGGSPAQTLTRLITRIEDEIGVTASVGLSHNKFLAKLASDMDKPRGFQVIGRAETLALLAP